MLEYYINLAKITKTVLHHNRVLTLVCGDWTDANSPLLCYPPRFPKEY